MPAIYWTIEIHYDDDPTQFDAVDRFFYTESSAVQYVKENMRVFFPFAYPIEDKVKVVTEGSITTFSYLTERIVVRPQIKQ
jgi:hypothetical protein